MQRQRVFESCAVIENAKKARHVTQQNKVTERRAARLSPSGRNLVKLASIDRRKRAKELWETGKVKMLERGETPRFPSRPLSARS